MDRSDKYAQIPADEPRFLEGVRRFNAGAYVESHETWESLWHDLAGPERPLLQGLIQIAAAYHHRAAGNRRGALYLYGRARPRLAAWAPAHAGLDLSAFLRQLDADFQLDRAAPSSAPPLLHLTH